MTYTFLLYIALYILFEILYRTFYNSQIKVNWYKLLTDKDNVKFNIESFIAISNASSMILGIMASVTYIYPTVGNIIVTFIISMIWLSTFFNARIIQYKRSHENEESDDS